MDWFSKGCEECRQGFLSGKQPPPTRIAVSEGPIFLYRCEMSASMNGAASTAARLVSRSEDREISPGVSGDAVRGDAPRRREAETNEQRSCITRHHSRAFDGGSAISAWAASVQPRGTGVRT